MVRVLVVILFILRSISLDTYSEFLIHPKYSDWPTFPSDRGHFGAQNLIPPELSQSISLTELLLNSLLLDIQVFIKQYE